MTVARKVTAVGLVQERAAEIARLVGKHTPAELASFYLAADDAANDARARVRQLERQLEQEKQKQEADGAPEARGWSLPPRGPMRERLGDRLIYVRRVGDIFAAVKNEGRHSWSGRLIDSWWTAGLVRADGEHIEWTVGGGPTRATAAVKAVAAAKAWNEKRRAAGLPSVDGDASYRQAEAVQRIARGVLFGWGTPDPWAQP